MKRLFIRSTSLLTLALATTFLTGCATSLFQPKPQINTVVLANNSNTTAHEVTILVEAFGGKFYCGTILAGTQCSTRFPAREYEGNPVTVSWVQNGITHETAPFVVPVGESTSEKPMTALLTLMADSSVDARLEVR